MARKEITIELMDRETPRTFRIKEMPATKLESWIIRAVLLLAGTGANIPNGNDIQAAGAYLSEHGLSALGSIEYEKAAPLLDDLLGCCSIVIDKIEKRMTPDITDDYIQDVRTLFKLRMEAGKLNLGFFKLEGGSASVSQENRPTATQ